MASILTIALICATIVACMHIRSKTKIAIAAAQPAQITLVQEADTVKPVDGGHIVADAQTGEILSTEEDMPAQVGVNQTGRWATPS